MMKALQIVFCLVLGIIFGVNAESQETGGLITAEETPSENSKERFLDGLLDDLDVHLDKLVNQGASVVKKVQQIQGQGGVTTITKTEVTQSFSSGGNFPVGGRFKRDLFDDMKIKLGNKVNHIADKVTGAIADGVNIGYEEYQKIKGEINNRLRD